MGCFETIKMIRNEKIKKFLTLIMGFSILPIALSIPVSVQPEAGALIRTLSFDTDNDLLPDRFEEIYGTDPLNEDSDGDGVLDGMEYVLKSNANDAADIPIFEPSMRIAAYQVDSTVKLCLIFLPGNPTYLKAFTFNLAIGNENVNLPNNGEQLDLTPYIPLTISDFSYRVSNNLDMSCYVINLPASIIRDCAPVSIGTGGDLVDTIATEVVDLTYIDNIIVRKMPASEFGGDGVDYHFYPLVSELPAAWSSEMVCETEMEYVETNNGVSTYKIVDAECTEVMNQLCSQADCVAQIGSEIITIDPGYLTEKLK